jgi:hypothetical protein
MLKGGCIFFLCQHFQITNRPDKPMIYRWEMSWAALKSYIQNQHARTSTMKSKPYQQSYLFLLCTIALMCGKSKLQAQACACAPTHRRGADKSLARPGRKQATVTKLGIYSKCSPRSSIHFLACCSNLCKLIKKNSEGCPWQQWPPRRTKKWPPFNCFFSPGNRW